MIMLTIVPALHHPEGTLGAREGHQNLFWTILWFPFLFKLLVKFSSRSLSFKCFLMSISENKQRKRNCIILLKLPKTLEKNWNGEIRPPK